MPQNEVVLSSVSDSEEDIRAALGMKTDPAPEPAVVAEPVAAVAKEGEIETVAEPAKELAKEPAKPEAKKEEPTGAEKRINDLVRQKHEAVRAEERKRYEIEADRDRIAKELEAIKAAKESGQPEAKPEPVAEAPKKPEQADFATFEEWQDALVEWKTEQKVAAATTAFRKEQEQRELDARQRFEAQQQEAAQRQMIDEYNKRVESAKAKYADYDEVKAQSESIPVSEEMRIVLMASPIGPDIGYYLANNPAEVDRINAAPPLARFVEMGRLEAMIHHGLVSMGKAPARAVPEAQVVPAPKPTLVPPRPLASKAPMPPPKVNAGVVAPQKDPSDMTHSEYSAWRAAGGGR